MRIEKCSIGGVPGYKYTNGICFTYTEGDKASEAAAFAKAEQHGVAIRAFLKRERAEERRE